MQSAVRWKDRPKDGSSMRRKMRRMMMALTMRTSRVAQCKSIYWSPKLATAKKKKVFFSSWYVVRMICYWSFSWIIFSTTFWAYDNQSVSVFVLQHRELLRPCRNIEHDNEHPVTLSGSLGHVNSSIGSIVFPVANYAQREGCLCTLYNLQGELTPVDVTQCCLVQKSKSVVYFHCKRAP